ncbi:MAG: type III secretion system export apparatus subunit SctR [Deltaproteobacteria bacterium]|nr:type III secretion system export apparatus subunit SctR [Deltaproteobacteria bacterium]
MLALAALSLLPFVFLMTTSFVKISVVLSILRNAIGTQQIPPGTVVTGLAAILTIYVMYPTGASVAERLEPLMGRSSESDLLSRDSADLMIQAAGEAREPIRRFLQRNSNPRDRALFLDLARRSRPQAARADVHQDDLLVLVPAFVITELAEAFLIGLLIFVPFLVVEVVVANTLMALGMHMLSPTTISLPFKLLLFVMVDGWYLIARGLVLGYS